MSTVPCELCSMPTPMTGTKRCDRCWELEHRIHGDPELARKILSLVQPEELRTEPMAWAVWMPKGHEFDYIVFPDKQDALNEIGFKELEDDALEPLFARSPPLARKEP